MTEELAGRGETSVAKRGGVATPITNIGKPILALRQYTGGPTQSPLNLGLFLCIERMRKRSANLYGFV
jgi:hypothetical protein